MVLVLSRQKPHLILFLVLSLLSGIGYLASDPKENPGSGKLPAHVSSTWAWLLVVTGLIGLAGIVWQRWHVERGMLVERGALLLQSGAVVVYAGFLAGYHPPQWALSVTAAAVWSGINIWEARLIKRDLGRLEVAADGH